MINQKNLTNEIDIFRLKREKNLILKSKIFNLKINIVFFGASSALNKLWNIFLEQSIIPDYICDNDANKHGKSFNGYLISHPDDIFNKNELYLVFITSSFFNQIYNQLKIYTNVVVAEEDFLIFIYNSLKLDIHYSLEYKKIFFKESKSPLVSIIIPVFNQFHYTYDCLKSIFKYTENVEFEIIIADDLSTDNTINLKEYVENIKYIRNDKNLGFIKNCNNASKFATGKYILFLNNDTQVQKNWLNSLLEIIETNEKIGMVGSKLIYPNGRLQEAGGIIWNNASGLNYGKSDDPTKSEYNYLKEVDYISGASIIIKKDLWQKIGGFDERYAPAYFEDTDLAFEVRKNGYKVIFQPKSLVVHFEGISHGTSIKDSIKKYQLKNKEKFFKKWKKELQKNHFQNTENLFFARDRSKDCKHILVIDHMVPLYDRDAGSRTIYQHLMLLKEIGYHVTFIGNNHITEKKYIDILEQNGIEVLEGNYSNYPLNAWIIDNCKYFDYVYLIRPEIADDYLEIILSTKNKNTKLIYYVMDFHFLRLERQFEFTNNPLTYEESKRLKYIEYNIFEKVDSILTISSEELKFLNKNFNHKKSILIPTFIYKQSLPLSPNQDLKFRNGLLFVGGFSHIPNLDGINYFLNNSWDIVKNKIPSITLHIVGSNVPDTLYKFAQKDKMIFIYENLSDIELFNLYDNVRITIAPIRYGAGVKGKIVESIAHGVPIVTTNIGAEGIIDANNIMLIADEYDSFADKIYQLYENNILWNKIRNEQIKYAESYFSYKNVFKLLREVFL